VRQRVPERCVSHSFGLETAIAERGLAGAAGVRAWIADYLERSLATLDARAFVLGMRGTVSVDELDAVLAASVFPRDVRRQIAVWRALPWRHISLWES